MKYLPVWPSVTLTERALRLRRAWFVGLAIAIATYAYVLFQFPTGNHDWTRMDGLEFHSYQVRVGRWFAPAIYALTGFRQLPVLNALIGLVGYVSAGFATCLFIEALTKKELPAAAHLVAGLLCALLPFGNWTFYYSWMAGMGPLAQLFCVLGLTYVARTPRPRGVAWGGLVICVSLATYQAAIDTAAVLFWLAAILWLVAPGASAERRRGFRGLIALAGSIALGAGLYKLSLSTLSAGHLLSTTSYHFRFISWAEFPARLAEVRAAAAAHMVDPHPFFSVALKLSLLALMLVGVAVLIARGFAAFPGRGARSVATAVGVVVGVALMILCTKIQFLVGAKDNYFDNRFASFGLTYVYVPLIVLGLGGLGPIARRVHLAACISCIWACVVSDLSWQDAHVKQNQYDKRFVERLITRIESQPGFSYEKKYHLVQLGSVPDIRRNFFDYSGTASAYHEFTMMASWRPHEAYLVMEPRFDIESVINLKKLVARRPTPRVNALMEHLQASQPWPHESSVAIVNNILVVVIDKDGFGQVERVWKRKRRQQR